MFFLKPLLAANKWFFWQLLVCAFIEQLCLTLAHINQVNVHIYAAYTPVEFFLLARTLGATNKTANLNHTVLPLSVLLAGLSALEYFKYTGSKFPVALSVAVEYFLLAVFALHTFYRIMEEQVDGILFTSPRFWLAAAVLMYTSATLVIFLGTYYFFTIGMPEPQALTLLHAVINITFHLMLSIAVVCYRTPATQS